MTVTEQVLKAHRENRREINQLRKMLNDDILYADTQKVTHTKDYYIELLKKYDLEHCEIEKMLACLTVKERTILREYYLSNGEKTWEEIGTELHFSMQHIFRLRKSALKKLSQFI